MSGRLNIFLLSIICIVITSAYANAQDTIRLTLKQAEEFYISRNAQLIAARFGIESARARVLQASLLPNPNIAVEHNLYNPSQKSIFSFTGDASNSEISLQQTLLINGQREQYTALAQAAVKQAETDYLSTLRQGRQALRINMLQLHSLEMISTFYRESLNTVQRTLENAKSMYNARSILLSEVLRLQSLQFTLSTEYSGFQSQIITCRQNIVSILHDTTGTIIVPAIDQAAIAALNPARLNEAQLYDIARRNRADLQATAARLQADSANLRLQQALAMPNVTVGLHYSRSGSTYRDYTGITAAIDLPFFNKNQGNIQSAVADIEQDYAQLKQLMRDIQRDISTAFMIAQEKERLYRTFDQQLPQEYKKLISDISDQYMKRNIRLIEYTDFFEAYRTSMVQLLQMNIERLKAFEDLNNACGELILNP
jgi:cobalt-zinc-cadmium efflux system outer membrane protein